MTDYSFWPNYKFGIELEMFLAFKRQHSSIEHEETMVGKLEKAADNICRFYNYSVSKSDEEGDVRYYEMVRYSWDTFPPSNRPPFWEIHKDSSLYPFGIEKCPGWPLEFASPIFDYSVMISPDHAFRGRYIPPWLSSIIKLFKVLEDETIIFVNDECTALQVSVSANDHYGWDSLDQVKSLSKSILYFESAIHALLPQPRRDNEYAKWNGSPTQTTSTTTHTNPRFQGTFGGVGSRIALVDACATVEELVELMNNGSKRWSWNFMDLKADENSNMINGRVEFRSPPGVNNWRECSAWIHFTIEFVHAAISTSATIQRLVQFEIDWQGLMKFLDSVFPLMSRDLKLTYRRQLRLPVY